MQAFGEQNVSRRHSDLSFSCSNREAENWPQYGGRRKVAGEWVCPSRTPLDTLRVLLSEFSRFSRTDCQFLPPLRYCPEQNFRPVCPRDGHKRAPCANTCPNRAYSAACFVAWKCWTCYQLSEVNVALIYEEGRNNDLYEQFYAILKPYCVEYLVFNIYS